MAHPPSRAERRARRAGGVPRRLLATLAVLGAGVTAGILLAPGDRHAGREVGASARASASANAAVASLPAPATGFAIPAARELRDRASVTRWAPVLHGADAHVAPSQTSATVTAVATSTPEGTANVVVADGQVRRAGREWVRVRLAVLPNGREGWLPRSALGGWSFVDTRLVVDRTRLTATLYRGGRPVFRAPVGVGAPATPTPAGRFYVRDRLTAYASPAYGPLAFGLSARAPHETDWPAGGFIGIHGTDAPGAIPGRISHGCVRLRNAAIRVLGRLMPVGTPVTIR